MASRRLPILETYPYLGAWYGIQAQRSQMESSNRGICRSAIRARAGKYCQYILEVLPHERILIVLQKSGAAFASFCKTLLDDDRPTEDQEISDIKWTANTMYAGL